MSLIVIDSQYTGTVSYYALLLHCKNAIIDGGAYFMKGTYRNRCHIAGANGLLRLSIPLKRGKNQKRPMREVEISYNHDWQKLHWESICSAYRRSPYFEFYEDDFQVFYHNHYDRLINFNQSIRELICSLLDIEINVQQSDHYISTLEEGTLDCRNYIHPNLEKNQLALEIPRYQQLFEAKNGFLQDLSILDLLFMQGPRAKDYLERIASLIDLP